MENSAEESAASADPKSEESKGDSQSEKAAAPEAPDAAKPSTNQFGQRRQNRRQQQRG